MRRETWRDTETQDTSQDKDMQMSRLSQDLDMKNHISRHSWDKTHLSRLRYWCISVKEVVFSSLFVCLSLSNFVQKLPNGFAWNFQGRLAIDQLNKWLNFGRDPDHGYPDPSRDTGRTCLGRGMHCSIASSFHYAFIDSCNACKFSLHRLGTKDFIAYHSII